MILIRNGWTGIGAGGCLLKEPGSETIRIEDLEQAGGAGREHCLEVLLRISGTLLVRTYAVAFTRTEDIPDYGQMTVGGHGKQAVIPGSSWAGLSAATW